ncbi:transcription termination factor MTEF1, chloroplastic [Magnolia sinica]|uniref:transcription termination factor MTEF1, chloroplastic n=1 Tax=Magnolia sinica TaxID=86752 RepID=UPI00265B25D5|nr:transcription termination factor MTEF1, chloroplastic [Magnolia sinica]XP_058087779.1 transcription termination factor MTEF1, chloroplastic [Magnolia sinica]XP_058087780.1 transcription termination factor MTEF1, chloroplastic [Magnolia sinica]
MEKVMHLSTISTPLTHHHQNSLPKPSPTISFPQKPPQNPKVPSLTLPNSPFFHKTLYLESIGLDPLPLINSHPPIASSSLPALKSTVHFLHSYGFSPSQLRRIFTMCPDALTASPSSILPVFTFLLREAKINGSDLVPSINRRPRLLVSDVARRLRPTLYFLQTLGIADVSKHTSLLSCSVEDKFLPRLEYLQKIGFSYRDSVSMVRRFPPLFCYSIESNFEPKFEYFAFEMGRDLSELREFPQYFSFSLDRRIKPRHRMCADKGVSFPLLVMLKGNDQKFCERLEVCVSSSPPLRLSPLWC